MTVWLELPPVQSYLPSGTGESALANVSDWVEVWYDCSSGSAVPSSAPRPEGNAWIRGRRETNTMPQWAGSCWYYLRFTDPANDRALCGKDAERYWMGTAGNPNLNLNLNPNLPPSLRSGPGTGLRLRLR